LSASCAFARWIPAFAGMTKETCGAGEGLARVVPPAAHR
jgi:hypothetical protein